MVSEHAKKRIVISSPTRQAIMSAFGCSKRVIRKALNFESGSDTDLCRRIRKYAVEKEGIVQVILKDVETIHDSDGVMRQYFGNGAILEFDKRTGMGYLRHKGEIIKSYPHVQISQIAQIQTEAASL